MKIKNDFLKNEQIEIIDSQDKNLIVSASAGSGKTTVMVSKIVDLLVSEKAKLNSLLVLTYTTSAANEMKQKLLNELNKYSNEYEFLQDEIENISLCDISTIHGFCQKLIRKNFQYLKGIDPSFSILSQEQKLLFKTQAINEVFEEYKLKHWNEYLKLKMLYDSNRSDKKLIKIVFKINEYFESLLYPEEFRNKTAYFLYDNPQMTMEILNQSLIEKIEYYLKKFKELYEQSEQAENQIAKEYLIDILLFLKQISPANTFFENVKILTSVTFKQKKRNMVEDEILLQVFSKREALKKIINELKSKNFASEESLLSFEKTKEDLSQLLFLQKAFLDKYTQLKTQNNVLDFADLEKYAILLTENKVVAEELKEKIKYIFVDEFQDANEVQEKLLQNISRINNRFMVGDVKQSIYGFRRSNPQIFLETEERYSNDKNSECKNLNLNFRSDESILNFVNSIFKVIMTKQTAGIDYKETSMFKPFLKLQKSTLPRIKINLIEKKQERKKNIPTEIYNILQEKQSDDEEISQAHKEAFLVAKDILKLKNQYIQIGESTRKVNFADITILVRKRGKYYDEFVSELNKYKIPVYANSSKSIFLQPDCIKLTGLLSLSQNLFDDFSLAGIMLSMFGNFTFQDLANIKMQTAEHKYYYENVFEYALKKDELALRLQNFLQLIEEFSQNCQIKGVYFSLNEILNKTQYKEKTYALNDGAFRVISIEKFVDIFKNSIFNFNISSFLEFVKNQESEIKSPNYYVGEVDCINITTIHSSKGLEYPIVFFVQGGNDLTKLPETKDIVLNDKFGIGLKYFSSEKENKFNSYVYEVIEQKNFKEDFAEILRLLYVGLTRGKEYLYIYGSVSNKIETLKNYFDVFNSKSYLSLILGSFDQENLDKINSENEVEINQDNTKVLVCKYNEQDFAREDITENIVFSKGDENAKEQIKKASSFSYMYPEVFSIALKNSVSSLLKQEDYESLNFAPNKFTTNEHLIEKASELGQAYHKILQTVNFENVTKEQIEHMIKNEVQNQTVDAEKILQTVNLVKKLVGNQKCFKEEKFIMQVKYNEITDSNLKDFVLVQGVIDLFSFGQNNVLIDYKLTSLNSDEKIIKKYKKQIMLYKKALEIRFKIKDINCYIIDINRQKSLKIE